MNFRNLTLIQTDRRGRRCRNYNYHWIIHSRREVEGFFKILDKNLDGKLSFEEFLGEENHIEKIFKTMDKDNDGFVSKSVSYGLNISQYLFNYETAAMTSLEMCFFLSKNPIIVFNFWLVPKTTTDFDLNQCSGSQI